MSTWQALHPPLPDATPSAWQMVPLTSFLLDWLLVTGVNECHQCAKAVADMYNIKSHQIASLSGFATKNQSINQSTFVKRHKSQANRRRESVLVILYCYDG